MNTRRHLPMTRRPAAVLLAAGLAVMTGCAAEAGRSAAPENEYVSVDHHVHLMSPELVADWKSLGVPFSRPDSVYTMASAFFHVSAGAAEPYKKPAQALFLPMAHLYGREEFREALGLSEAEEYAAVRRENDHVAAEAARWKARAVAFCGVDYLRPYAREELRRCREELGIRGIKLHLASAGTDLRDPRHLNELEQITEWAEENGVFLMMHFDPQQRGLETSDVEHFIAEVLQPHPGLRVCIAHMGGSGGYGRWTRSVFRTFNDWLDREEVAGRPRDGVYFDISGAWLEEESEGIPASTRAHAEALQEDLENASLRRIVFGSDYPVFDPAGYAGALRTAVQPDSAAWNQLMQNRLPLFSHSQN